MQITNVERTLNERSPRGEENVTQMLDIDIHKDLEESKQIVDVKKTITKIFKKPTFKEVDDYCKQRNNKLDASYFIDWYDSNGWKVGKNPMKSWQAAIRTWEKRGEKNGKSDRTFHERNAAKNDEARRATRTFFGVSGGGNRLVDKADKSNINTRRTDTGDGETCYIPEVEDTKD